MAIGSGNFGKILDGVQRHYYGLSYAQWEDMYTKYYDIRTSTKAYEEAMSFTGFTTIPVKVKGGSVSYEDAKQNWVNRHIHVTYGKGYIVERELWDDAQTNILKRLPAALARAVKESIEVLAAVPINSHTTETAGDAVAVGSASHLLGGAGGSTYSNLGTASDLSETSFEQMQIDISAWVDDAGLKMNAKPKMLMVTPTFAYTAAKLLGSDKTPEDNYNAINPAKGLIPYFVNPYITDADKWVVFTDVPDGMVFYWRDKPEFSQDNDFDTENAKWKVRFRCSCGVDDARGLYINAGA